MKTIIKNILDKTLCANVLHVLFLFIIQSECNVPACNYDNDDCKSQTRPWKNCEEPRGDIYCRNVFNDSKCDPQCDSEECLYDGFDCVRSLPACNPHYDTYCSIVYADGVCNKGCNTAACNWDGLDCDQDNKKLALGTLVIVVGVTPEEFYNMSNEFLRKLGHLLRAVLVVKKDSNGQNMIYPYYGEDTTSRRRRSVPVTTTASSSGKPIG